MLPEQEVKSNLEPVRLPEFSANRRELSLYIRSSKRESKEASKQVSNTDGDHADELLEGSSLQVQQGTSATRRTANVIRRTNLISSFGETEDEPYHYWKRFLCVSK